MSIADVCECIIKTENTNENESYKWTHSSTLYFLELYKKYRVHVGSLKFKNLKKMFEEIAKEMRGMGHRQITAANCENRWKVLERNYKKYINVNRKTARGRTHFEYADIMGDILGEKRSIHPVILLSSDTITNPAKNYKKSIPDDMIEQASTEHLRQPGPSMRDVTDVGQTSYKFNPKKTYANKTLKYNVLKEVRNDRKEYYRKRLEIETRMLEEKVKKNKLLEERNELLKKMIQKGDNIFIDSSITDV